MHNDHRDNDHDNDYDAKDDEDVDMDDTDNEDEDDDDNVNHSDLAREEAETVAVQETADHRLKVSSAKYLKRQLEEGTPWRNPLSELKSFAASWKEFW